MLDTIMELIIIGAIFGFAALPFFTFGKSTQTFWSPENDRRIALKKLYELGEKVEHDSSC